MGLDPATYLLYDVTTLWFETDTADGFRELGFSKERRLEPQITVGLLTNASGFPLMVHAFEGNRAIQAGQSRDENETNQSRSSPRRGSMAVQLAVALSGIAAQAIVTQFVQGSSFDRKGWANVAGQIVKAMIDTSRAQEFTLQQLGGGTLDDIPRREYDERMAAGRRYLREVTPQWRTARDRRDMIRDARGEFAGPARSPRSATISSGKSRPRLRSLVAGYGCRP